MRKNSHNNKKDDRENKKIILSVITLIGVLLVFIMLGTYSYWQVTKKQEQKNIVGSACLDITFDNESNDINISNMWPTSDSDGAKLVPYTFTVTNTCPDELVSYTVALESIEDANIAQSNYLKYNYLKVKLDGNTGVKYSTLDSMTKDNEIDYVIRDTKKLVTKRLAGGASRTHNLRLWIDSDTPLKNDDNTNNLKKYFFGKIKIIAGQAKEEECYAVNSEGVLYSYAADCGNNATIPATVGGTQVRTIASDAFKETLDIPVYQYKDFATGELVSSPRDFKNLDGDYISCFDSENVECEIDYSFVFSNRLGKIFYENNAKEEIMNSNNLQSEEEMNQWIANNFGASDVHAIIYYTGNNSAKLAAINNEINVALAKYADLLGCNIADLEVYNGEPTTISSEGFYEVYHAMKKEGNHWHSLEEDIGLKMPTDQRTRTVILAVDSLDLSQATNLEKVEKFAFVGFDSASLTENNLLNTDLGEPNGYLKVLTFGNNSRNITFDIGSFMGANLNDLTIYNSYNFIPSSNDSNLALYGPFAGAEIANLIIKQAGENTVYNSTICTMGDINTITIDEGITEIGSNAFVTVNGSIINIPYSVVSIGDGAFRDFQGEIHFERTASDVAANVLLGNNWKNNSATVTYSS